MPDADSAVPPRMTVQNTSFWPALKRAAGGCDLLKKPPPARSHAQSYRSGKLSFTQMSSMIVMPAMNGHDMKLCAILAKADQSAKASGPRIGISRRLPNT